jgi:hypothetical protein
MAYVGGGGYGGAERKALGGGERMSRVGVSSL